MVMVPEVVGGLKFFQSTSTASFPTIFGCNLNCVDILV